MLKAVSLREGGSYFAVVVIGLFIDLALSWLLATRFAVPLPIAGACGLVLAAVVNYVLWQRYTFASRDFSLRRLAATLAASLGTLIVRTALLAVLAPIETGVSTDVATMAKILIAAGVSFVLNFVVVRWIFKSW